MIKNLFNSKRGMQKILIGIFLLILIFILALEVYSAENEDEEISIEQQSVIENQTENEEELTNTEISSEIQKEIEFSSKLEIRINAPEKIIRGETFSLEISITNIGNADAESVILQIVLPEELNSIEEENIGLILPGETRIIQRDISSSSSSNLGSNEIKIILDYENAN